MRKRRSFTLLEVMVGLALLLLASGLVGWKMHAAVENKRFRSDLDRLEARFCVCQRLAIAMQADWIGELRKEGNEWIFDSSCIDSPNGKRLKPLVLHSFVLFFDGKQSDRFTLDFFSSGQILPEGTLQFCSNPNDPGSQKAKWRLPELFNREKSHDKKKLGPLHPED